MNRKALVFCSLCAAVLCASCQKESAEVSLGELPPAAADMLVRKGADKVVAVLYAYDFNESEYVRDFNLALAARFGMEEDGGAIRPLVYPDDFVQGKRTRISLIKSFVDEPEVCGVILLGAPEDTGGALADLRDKSGWNKPVFSFFPQDEVLPMEYAADFIVDVPDGGVKPNFETVFALVCDSIDVIFAEDGRKESKAQRAFVQKLVGADWSVANYTDSESAISAANHFIIETLLPPRAGTLE